MVVNDAVEFWRSRRDFFEIDQVAGFTCRILYIRAKTNRPQIQYSVHQTSDFDFQKSILQFIDYECQLLNGHEKVLIFCPSRALCDELASEIECCKYYSSLHDKDIQLQKWMNGEARVMIGTSALGAGLNVSGIVLVIHVEKPYSYIQFSQESGRAGRNGEVARSIIALKRSTFDQFSALDPSLLTADEAALQKYLMTDQCRHIALSQYLDGKDNTVNCTDIEGQLCDNCIESCQTSASNKRESYEGWDLNHQMNIKRIRSQNYSSHQTTVNDYILHTTIDREHSMKLIAKLQRHCPVCWLLSRTKDPFHDVDDCETFQMTCGDLIGLKNQLNHQRNSCCFSCSRPCDLCQEYVEKRPCKTKDVIIPIAFVAWSFKTRVGLEAVRLVANKDFHKTREYMRWLGMPIRVMEMNLMNGYAVFSEIAKRGS
jgi:hypothetical protein